MVEVGDLMDDSNGMWKKCPGDPRCLSLATLAMATPMVRDWAESKSPQKFKELGLLKGVLVFALHIYSPHPKK